MKISEMQLREDFYKIFINTLNEYFISSYIKIEFSNKKSSNSKKLIIHKRVNSILFVKPSKRVKSFLYTEYALRKSLFKKIFVIIYLKIILNCKNTFFQKENLYFIVKNKINLSDLLIFPCSKKIRFFDFDNRTVDVVCKSSFPTKSINREVELRKMISSDYILPIIESNKFWYRELIVDGVPLARVTNKNKYEQYKSKALKVLDSICNPYQQKVKKNEYYNKLCNEIKNSINIFESDNGELLNKFRKVISAICFRHKNLNGSMILTLSHGDFHHGNIWLERNTNKIIIIDWEAWSFRSQWYDIFTLYGGLRENSGIKKLIANQNFDFYNNFDQVRNGESIDFILDLVICEDLLFRIDDFKNYPQDIGIKELSKYINNLYEILLFKER